MERNLVKRLMTKDGSMRISFYREDDAESPRYMTDEPLHCEDFSRDYSIMTKKERESKSKSAAHLLRYFLQNFGDKEKIIAALKGNYKAAEHSEYENGIAYDRSRREWIMYSWIPAWTDYAGKVHEAHWGEDCSFCISIYDVDIYDIAYNLSDSMIDEYASKYMTDKVKIMSYGFGYNGEVKFSHEFSTDSEGIAWLEKDEFLNYSGNFESYWKENDCYDIEKGLVEEIEAWSNGEVYGFVVEKAIRTQVMKTYFNGEREDESYIETEWVEDDSCWGFYGEFDKAEAWMLDEAGLKKEELEEETL